MAEESQELAKVSDGNQSLAAVFGVSTSIWTSLDKRSPRQAMLYMKCINACDKRFDSIIGMTFDLTHIFAHRVSMVNEDSGVVDEATRVVLINAESETVECVSSGVARDVAALAHLFGEPPWEPPLRVTLKQRSLDNGKKRLFTLELSEQQPAGRFPDEPVSKRKAK